MPLPQAGPYRQGEDAWAWPASAEFRDTATAALRGGGLLLMAFLAALLAARRFGGALSTPLEPAALAATACALALAGLVVRLPIRQVWNPQSAIRNPQSVSHFLLLFAPAMALGLSAASVALPGTSRLGLVALFGPLVVEECWSLSHVWRDGSRSRRPAVALPAPHAADTPATTAPRRTAEDLKSGSLDADRQQPLSADVSQQLIRGRAADGRDECRGFVRAMFAAGQRTETVHLAFCPPFGAAPHWNAESIEGPPVAIRHVQLMPYGVRLELRLEKVPREPVMSLVRFAAVERRQKQISEATGG